MPAISWPAFPVFGDAAPAAGALHAAPTERAPRAEPHPFEGVLERLAAVAPAHDPLAERRGQ